jgi:hypothetical protein
MTIQHRLDATTQTWTRRDTPRVFYVEFNHKKVNPFRSGRYQADIDVNRHETQTRFGTLYPNGLVTLDSGVPYHSLSEMKEMLEAFGDVSDPVFLDEMESELPD